MKLKIKEILMATEGSYEGDPQFLEEEISSVTMDSRQVSKDALYVAFFGERVDGHDFVDASYEKGAICSLVEHAVDSKCPQIIVKNTGEALCKLATYYRRKLSVYVIGITGSVGKTSTKEMVASVLSTKFSVCKTKGNFNNEIGIPLTLLSIKVEDQVAVVEMGIDHFGEMHNESSMVSPDLVIMTNIGSCHLENLKDRDGVLKAKSEIFDFIAKDGVILLNGDDDKLQTIHEVKGIIPKTFGMNPSCNVYASDIESLGLAGSKFILHDQSDGENQELSIMVPVAGEHMIYNAMAGYLAGRAMGMEKELIVEGISKMQTISGRNNQIETKRYLILDDCYNANPMSMEAALKVLASAPGRKVAILGDMFELGADEVKLHGQVGKAAKDCGIDLIFAVGNPSRETAKEALGGHGMVLYFEEMESVLENLEGFLRDGDTVLVKASHGMGFSKIVDEIEKLGNR